MADNSLADSVVDDFAYLLVDSSASLTSKKFAKDIDAVVTRAKSSGVQKIISRATSVHSSREALRLCRLYPGLSAHESRLWTPDSEREILEVIRSPECVAFGETGVDFSRDFSPKQTQLQVFEKQLQMATHLALSDNIVKPVLVREVNAHSECATLLRAYSSAQIVMQLRGSRDHVTEYLQRGAYIAVSGLVLKDKTEDGVRSALRDKTLPLNRLREYCTKTRVALETQLEPSLSLPLAVLYSDSPYAYPNVKAAEQTLKRRSLGFLNRYCTFQRNEPCSLAATLESVSALMNSGAEDVALNTTFNALKVFSLKC
ncbi:unnamed protein product [Medioppia subpectinata]|uniref:Deoxyribonuclease TATDN1 n=1 Tax=Medioppia subpectinata TaxID=1979941 RepID=A0A7R9PXQ7_9ACAR|nr:unnamed protein product [Medioppia subpectinata]CAG2105066.1 unnamed protein product [Medioppia subpectinata]